jgi:hypothetical protein
MEDVMLAHPASSRSMVVKLVMHRARDIWMKFPLAASKLPPLEEVSHNGG